MPLLLMASNGRPGVFIEIGAFNGMTLSDTLPLEWCLNWTGLLIEAHPPTFAELLQSGRRATLIGQPACPNGQMVQFSAVVGAIAEFTSKYYKNRWHNAMGENSEIETVGVVCNEIRDMLRDAGHRKVHFLSLDTQVAEEVVLNTTDLAAVSIILVEAEFHTAAKNERVRNLLLANGFEQRQNPMAERRGHSGYNELYVRQCLPEVQNHSGSRADLSAKGLVHALKRLGSFAARQLTTSVHPHPTIDLLRTCWHHGYRCTAFAPVLLQARLLLLCDGCILQCKALKRRHLRALLAPRCACTDAAGERTSVALDLHVVRTGS